MTENKRWGGRARPLIDDLDSLQAYRFNRQKVKTKRRKQLIICAFVSLLVAFAMISRKITDFSDSRVVMAAGEHGSAKKEKVKEKLAVAESGGLELILPAKQEDIIGIGYHQAYNPKAVALSSELNLITEATKERVIKARALGRPVSFVMASRGRGSKPTSSVDIALGDGVVAKSPVSGRVTKVEPYLLYGNIEDVRIEIEPEGFPGLRLSIIHTDKPLVNKGENVEAGITSLATVRRLNINSQIDQYLGQVSGHIHIQINPAEGKSVAVSGS